MTQKNQKSIRVAKFIFPALFALVCARTQAAPTVSPVTITPVPSDSAKAMPSMEGPIAQVVSRKKEIYVRGSDKKFEFYFTPTTQLLKGGQSADFSALTEGMKVRVTYVLVGRRTDPVKVEILD